MTFLPISGQHREGEGGMDGGWVVGGDKTPGYNTLGVAMTLIETHTMALATLVGHKDN